MVDAINPMIGAVTYTARSDKMHGLGKTFPGAATPFGMVQLSPDTITGGDNGPGYSYEHPTIEGFSFTHLSGIGWYGDFGNFQVMPTTGPRLLDREKACSPFQHAHERAAAGFYSVRLDRYHVTAEMTAAPRAGMLRFTFPSNETARVQIDLGRRIGQKERWLAHSCQQVRVVGDRSIEGFMKCVDADGGWGRGAGRVNYTLHFRAEFSRPFAACGVWDKDRVLEDACDYTGTNTGFYAEFAPSSEPLLLKAGISYVDTAGARANLAHDIPGWDFDAVRAAARVAWSDALGRVAVEGGSPRERTIFATALYHAFIDPRAIADIDGRYAGSDGKIYRTDAFTMRTVFSGWDVFRSAFPLYTLVRPDVVSDTVNSMMRWTDLGPRTTLPGWDIFGCLSSCMGGTPLVSVIADAQRAGVGGFDLAHAYDLVVRSVPPRTAKPDATYHPGGLSATLDAVYYDWCASRLAAALDRADDAAFYGARAQCYTNVWCVDVGWMRSRLGDGRWMPWKGRLAHNQGTSESNPYQSAWFVPHDVPGLARLMGGRARFTDELETFFSGTPDDFLWNDFYNHANEPVHQAAYMFAYTDRPWLTQKWTRKICRAAYGDDVFGLCGNEDVGQMSAWYVLSAVGLHPVCPGSGIWILTSPVFEKATLRCRRPFTVIAHGASDPRNNYIQTASLNGQPLKRGWLKVEEITSGGMLELTLGQKPNEALFTEEPR